LLKLANDNSTSGNEVVAKVLANRLIDGDMKAVKIFFDYTAEAAKAKAADNRPPLVVIAPVKAASEEQAQN